MSGGQREFGELLHETMERSDPRREPIVFEPGEIEAFVAAIDRGLAQAQAENDAEEAPPAMGGAEAEVESDPVEAVTEADIRAFLENGTPFSHEQQRLLFAHAPTRESFLALKHEYAARLPGGARAEFHVQIAAASGQKDDYERGFAGGTLRISPVGIGQQVYVVFSFDDPAIATRVLIVQRARDARIERVELPSPDAGEILLIKDLAVPADAELVKLLQDPNATGEFLS